MTEKEKAIARLHLTSCPVPMWEMVGKHYGSERPRCNCGAEKSEPAKPYDHLEHAAFYLRLAPHERGRIP